MTLNPALHAALVDVEGHVAAGGWDQPARLFALVETAALLRAEPGLADTLGVGAVDPGGLPGLTPIPQEDFDTEKPLDQALARLAWGPAVDGAAIVVERLMLPADAEQALPADDDELAAYVRAHPDREEVRMVVGVLRDGSRDCALRLRSADDPMQMLFGPGLVPGLADALAATLLD